MPVDVRRINAPVAIALAVLGLLLAAAAVAPLAKAVYEKEGVTYGSRVIEYSTEVSTTQAGAHPDVKFHIKVGTKLEPENPVGTNRGNSVKELKVETPEGFIGDPHATPQCSKADFILERCSPDSQIGWVNVGIEFTEGCRGKTDACDGFVPCCGMPLYNIIPPPDQAGLLGFQAILFGYPTYTVLSARTGGDFGLDATVVGIAQVFPIRMIDQYMWGVPASPIHDERRWEKGGLIPQGRPFKSNAPEVPFLSNPTTCVGPLESTFSNVAYDGVYTEKSAPWPETTGCDLIGFDPSLSASPSTKEADSAAGIDVDTQIPQIPSPVAPTSSSLKSVRVEFPEGFSINPNAADGKVACSDASAKFGTELEAECPQFSKVGSLSLLSSALPEAIPGSIYLGDPLPGDRYRTIATANGFGTHIKLLGTSKLDPQTGQLTFEFPKLPQTPFTRFQMHFFGSERGLFSMPTRCGRYPVEATFTPWNNVLPDQRSIQFFEVTSGPGGSPCPGAQRPFSPRLRAVGQVNGAGLHNPLSVLVSREDGDQNLGNVSVKLPPGFLATVKGIPYCSDAAITNAASLTGLAETLSPSCPAASRVGTSTSGAGSGNHPLYSPGAVYLAGPYKGAPLSLAIVTPALSGPYDLGNVVVRVALDVNSETAQVTAVSDPLPRILEGIPLRLRSFQLDMDRPGFTLNPTSCEPFAVQATIAGNEGAVAIPSNYFQVGNCRALKYEPKLSLTLSGGLARRGHPAIRAVLTARPGEANTSRVSVALPPGQLLDNSHINTICTRVQFAADACPAGSLLGTAEAKTPLLDQPLEGNAYLRSGPNKLPDIAIDLRGQIDIVLVGKIDTVKGALRTTFQTVPDAPVERFQLNLAGGKKGLIQNSQNVCGRDLRAAVKMVGQNGAHRNTNQLLETTCNAKRKKSKKDKRGK